ncbi:hypothetical protein, partial [Burkholderia sp. SIMBA_024]|uniref:hypothetical protein n=1 Tax=Burkholderia sp. SIMBA_024 TaxID=3085768 RepID=UPI003979C29F
MSEAIRNKRVDAGVMGLYEAAVLVFAEQETAARTKAHAAKVAAALVGETVTDRHQRAASERYVKVRSVGDGLALLTAVLPEWVAVAIADRLRQMTRQVIRNRAHARDDAESARDDGSVIVSDDTFAMDPDTDTGAGCETEHAPA